MFWLALILPALQEQLAKINAELQALRVLQSRHEKRERQLGLTDRTVKLVVATYMMSDYDLDLAELVGRMLTKQGGQRHSQQHGQNSIPVRDWFRTLPMATLDGINVPTCQADHLLRRDAAKMVAEVRTARWVRDENFDRGLATASDAVARTYAEHVTSIGEGPRTDQLLQSAESVSKEGRRTLRAWAAGFRERWDIANNHMACVDAPQVGELGAKAVNVSYIPSRRSQGPEPMIPGSFREGRSGSESELCVRRNSVTELQGK